MHAHARTRARALRCIAPTLLCAAPQVAAEPAGAGRDVLQNLWRPAAAAGTPRWQDRRVSTGRTRWCTREASGWTSGSPG
eukprot:1488554-Prymnesium_polylepis.1